MSRRSYLSILAVLAVAIFGGLWLFFRIGISDGFFSDAEILAGSYRAALDPEAAYQNMNYSDIAFEGEDGTEQNDKMLSVPVSWRMDPSWGGELAEIGFLNVLGEEMKAYGKFELSDHKLTISEPEPEEVRRVSEKGEDFLLVKSMLSYNVDFCGMDIKFKDKKNELLLSNDCFRETEHIILAGSVSSDPCQGIEKLYLKYKEGSDGALGTNRTAVLLQEDEDISWSPVSRMGKENAIGVEFEVNGIFYNFINAYPWGFIIVEPETGKYYKYLQTTDRSGVYPFSDNEIQEMSTLAYQPFEELYGANEKEWPEEIQFMRGELKTIIQKEDTAFGIELVGTGYFWGEKRGKQIWCGMDKYILRTEDGGKEWETAVLENGCFSGREGVYLFENGEVVVQSASEKSPVLYISKDFGESFQRIIFSGGAFTKWEVGLEASGKVWVDEEGRIVSEWEKESIGETTMEISLDASFDEYVIVEKSALP